MLSDGLVPRLFKLFGQHRGGEIWIIKTNTSDIINLWFCKASVCELNSAI